MSWHKQMAPKTHFDEYYLGLQWHGLFRLPFSGCSFEIMGYQLTPVKLSNVRCLIHFVSNLILSSIVLYGLIALDIFNVEGNVNELNRHFKPLIGTVVLINLQYAYPLSQLMYSCHFMIYGRQIVSLLDCEHFARVYSSKSKSVVIFVFVFVFCNGTYLLTNRAVIQWALLKPQSVFMKVVSVFSSYILYLDLFVVYGIVLYFKYGTCMALVNINRQRINELKSLALIHNELNRLSSFPLASYFVANIVDGVGSICLWQIYPQVYTILTYQICTVLCLLYIAHLDAQTQATLTRIFRKLKGKPSTTKLFRRHSYRNVIRLHEIELYRTYFQLRLYRLCVFDYQFVLHCALFVLNYSLLVIQTSL